MADLHNALKQLSPVQWADVPQDDLPTYLTECFTAGELICNSVPQPPNGEPFHSSKPHHETPNTATSSKEMLASSSRAFPPHQQHQDLQTNWGKPIKVNANSNPHGVSVYKMAGHDRHGAWFARRSVHEGIGFTKFQEAMAGEFPHSLTVQGGPGAGAVRGLAGDHRLEEKHVDGMGKLEVYQLSAQFPGPVAPRDFMTLVMTTEDALGEKSAAEAQDGTKHVPRHYMIVSRPVVHPDEPQRSGFVRGQYESVELVREIPLHHAQSQSSPNTLSPETAEDGQHGHTKDETSHDPELNPVEWIMITRSDPGGGIPRFLVDRGTPDAMLGDITKFLDWACSRSDSTAADLATDHVEGAAEQKQVGQPTTSAPNGHVDGAAVENGALEKSAPETVPQQQQQGGIMSNMANALQIGVDAYAPTAVSNYLHTGQQEPADYSSDSSSDSSSAGSFMSAEEMRRQSTIDHPNESTDVLSIASASSSTEAAAKGGDKKHLNHNEKEVQKLMQQREKLDRKLAKKREEEEKKLRKSEEKDQTEQEKAKEKHEKDMQKVEQKHRKEVEKLERRKAKEAQKAEEKRLKKDDAAKLSLVSRERDEFRGQLDSHKRENQLLLQRIEELQRENTVMANHLGKLGGPDAVKGVQSEVDAGRKRAVSSARSHDSKKSLEVPSDSK